MSAIQLLLQAEAAEKQAAVRKRVFRHVYIDDEPLIVVTYNLSGEAAAPIAFLYGTSLEDARLSIAAEPRNREMRFSAIHEFACALDEYLSTRFDTVEVPSKYGKPFDDPVRMPQIWVPNRGTRDFLGARLGRSLRYLDRGPSPATHETVWAGSYLSWFDEQRHYPGQNLFLAATEELTRHYATGQSALEDENLAVLLAWVRNRPGSGVRTIREAETAPAFGPVPEPELEVTLDELLRRSAEARRADDKRAIRRLESDVAELVKPQLMQGFSATLDAIHILRSVPEARSVPKRAEADKRRWGTYIWRAGQGIPRFARRHDAIRAARLIEEWSHAAEHLEADEAFDDPLVMAELDAAGRCITGTVKDCDTGHKEIKSGNTKASYVPLVRVKLTAPTRLLPGDDVTWTAERKVTGEVRDLGSDSTVVIALMSGHNYGKNAPVRGDQVQFVDLQPFGGGAPPPVDDVPWTHKEPVDAPRRVTSDESGPNLSPRDVLALPVADLSDPDAIPGVVL
jgi:hypothetical protein